VEPTEPFTVADWLSQADATIAGLQRRGITPIVVGGTNLYVKALLEGLFEGPAPDEALRAQFAALPCLDLHQRLQAVDPPAAARIHPNDRKRLTRALEVFQLTGKPISQWQSQWSDAPPEPGQYRHRPRIIGLNWPTDAINHRINLRVKAMFFPDKARQQDGLDWWPPESLPQETARLEAASLLGVQAREALGYKQVLEHFAGQATLEEAFEKTKVQTRRFARQQRTWLRRFVGVKWLSGPETTLDAALAALCA
jgi:tRNA dimethylallyltransferase